MKLQEVAVKIGAHLKRFEADPKINTFRPGSESCHKYYIARAWAGGSRVMVSVVCYQGYISLTKEKAEGYLKWLDAGNVGSYYKYKGR